MAIETAPRSAVDPVDDGVHGADVRVAPSANASEKTLLVLEAALTHARFTDVVEATGLAKATTHRILSTLVDRRARGSWALAGSCRRRRPRRTAGRALERIDISAIAQP